MKIEKEESEYIRRLNSVVEEYKFKLYTFEKQLNDYYITLKDKYKLPKSFEINMDTNEIYFE